MIAKRTAISPYGSTAADANSPLNRLSPAQAVALLVKDANARVATILAKTTVPLTQDQLDALVDFQFNTNGYPGSALHRVINQGKFDQAPSQFGRWVHGVVGRGRNAHMEVLPGLVARRAVDSRIWTKGQFPPVKHLPEPGRCLGVREEDRRPGQHDHHDHRDPGQRGR